MAAAGRGLQRVVARAHRAARLARAAETFLVGASGTLLALSAIAWQDSSLASLSAWTAALLAGAFGGAAWWVDVRSAPRAIAGRIDRELSLDGAFFTAWEGTSGAQPAPLVQLLAERLEARVSAPRALRSVLPNSMPFLALPFLAATLLALARGIEPDAPASRDWSGRVSALAGAMEDVESAAHASLRAGEIDAQALRELVELNAKSRALSRRARSDEWRPEEARPDLAALAEELERQARELSPLSELTAALERAAARADSMQQRAGGEPPAAAAAGADAPQRTPGRASPGEGGGESGAGLDPELANGVAGGTMQDHPRVDQAAVESSGTPGQGDPGSSGVASGRWWSERDAPVVERWQRWLRETQRTQGRDQE